MLILSIIALLILLLLFVGNYFYNLALNRNYNKDFLFNNAEQNDDSTNNLNSKYSNEKELLKKWDLDNVFNFTFKTFDDLKLSAYYYDNNNNSDKYVIIVHGYLGKAEDMLYASKIFFDSGYSVLSFDLRGHANSEGDYIGMGWHDRLDLIQLIDLITSKNPDAEIVLYGVSMGAATVMMASGEDLPKNVKVIIEDCGYTSIKDIFSYQLKLIFKLPSFPIINFADIITRIRAKFSFFQGNCLKQVGKSTTPILFIHGDKDLFVPFNMLEPLYNSCNCKKDILIVENAEHGMAAFVYKERYWEKVFNFINSCL